MSWDIYGNALRRGHCEVHPQVHEEYPCSLCYAEDAGRNRPDQRQQDRQPEPEYPSYRIVANIKGADHEAHVVIITYEYNEIGGDNQKDILSLYVYPCYPSLVKKIDNLFEQVRDAINNIEGTGNTCFLTQNITIL
jgi:hypothetical protein